LNQRVLTLALGTFAIGTGSFVFVGLIEGVAGDLSVSVATAGHLVTVFAVTYAVSSPVLATRLLHLIRRTLVERLGELPRPGRWRGPWALASDLGPWPLRA
jgi:predicted MFS family arabinose efflux permease